MSSPVQPPAGGNSEHSTADVLTGEPYGRSLEERERYKREGKIPLQHGGDSEGGLEGDCNVGKERGWE